MKKILFITPTFARTGSEIVLWNLIKNLDPKKYEIFLFSIKKGELLNVLPPHIKTAVSYKFSGKWNLKWFRAILKLLGVENQVCYQLRQIQKEFKADLWFVNTIIVPDAYLAAATLNVKVATYFHEIGNALALIKGGDLQRILTFSHTCVGCSEIVVEKLQELGHENIKLQNSSIDEGGIQPNERIISNIKDRLGITSEDFIWVISGTASYMKGLDLILPLLKHFKNTRVKFLWLGEHTNTGLDLYVKSAAERISPGQVIFTGPLSEDYYSYLAAGNGLLILSREETFSLVMLEAAYLQMPIVGYDSGMLSKFIENDMGRVVTGLDSDKLCQAMEWVQQNQASINRTKLHAKTKRFTLQSQIPLFGNLLKEILEETEVQNCN
jgi:glycosyltransferase involved in cell wall biosynthesis